MNQSDHGSRKSGAIVRPPTLAATVAVRIRESIFSGEFEQGQGINEQLLARTYKVSRPTVREAIRSLHEDGLVTLEPHRGASVCKLSYDLIEDSYEIRLILEPFALRRSHELGRLTPGILHGMNMVAEEMNLSIAAGDYLGYMRGDHNFHKELVRHCGNDFLVSALRKPQTYSRLSLTTVRVILENLPTSGTDHSPILRPLANGDIEDALGALVAHLESSARVLLSHIPELTSSP